MADSFLKRCSISICKLKWVWRAFFNCQSRKSKKRLLTVFGEGVEIYGDASLLDYNFPVSIKIKKLVCPTDLTISLF